MSTRDGFEAFFASVREKEAFPVPHRHLGQGVSRLSGGPAKSPSLWPVLPFLLPSSGLAIFLPPTVARPLGSKFNCGLRNCALVRGPPKTCYKDSLWGASRKALFRKRVLWRSPLRSRPGAKLNCDLRSCDPQLRSFGQARYTDRHRRAGHQRHRRTGSREPHASQKKRERLTSFWSLPPQRLHVLP